MNEQRRQFFTTFIKPPVQYTYTNCHLRTAPPKKLPSIVQNQDFSQPKDDSSSSSNENEWICPNFGSSFDSVDGVQPVNWFSYKHKPFAGNIPQNSSRSYQVSPWRHVQKTKEDSCEQHSKTPVCVYENKSSNQFSLGVRLPLSLFEGSKRARPPSSSKKPPKIRIADQSDVKQTGCTTRPPCTVIDLNEATPYYKCNHSPEPREGAGTANSSSSSQVNVADALDTTDRMRSSPSIKSGENSERDSISRPTKLKVAFLEPDDDKRAVSRIQCATTAKFGSEADQRSEPKLSPSARFPGWCVVTDDEEDEEVTGGNRSTEDSVEEKRAVTPKRTKTNWPGGEENPKAPHPSGSVRTSDPKARTVIIKGDGNGETEVQIYPNAQLPQHKLPTLTDERQRYQIQQAYLRRNDTPRSSSKSGFTLRQPRKSLAAIFSNLSNNLGFTNNAPRCAEDGGTLDSMSSTDSLPMDRPTSRHASSQIHVDGADPNEPKLVVDKRTSRVSIQLGKSQDQSVYMNGDLSRRAETGRKATGLNSLINSPKNRGSDLGAAHVCQPNCRSYLGSETTMNHSFLVDLLCCTCCTRVDDEEYSNLIENHKLARFVTMAAVLTILGLILAYIIRSAMESTSDSVSSISVMSTPSPNPTSVAIPAFNVDAENLAPEFYSVINEN